MNDFAVATSIPALAALLRQAGRSDMASLLLAHVSLGEGAVRLHGKIGPFEVGALVGVSASGDGGIRIDLRLPGGALDRRPVENLLASLIAKNCPWARLECDKSDGDRTLRIAGVHVDSLTVTGGTLSVAFSAT